MDAATKMACDTNWGKATHFGKWLARTRWKWLRAKPHSTLTMRCGCSLVVVVVWLWYMWVDPTDYAHWRAVGDAYVQLEMKVGWWWQWVIVIAIRCLFRFPSIVKTLVSLSPPASSRPIDKWIKAVSAKQKISIITLINTADNCLKSPDNRINPAFCATAFFLRLNSLLPHPP